jgi:hypothetical protein
MPITTDEWEAGETESVGERGGLPDLVPADEADENPGYEGDLGTEKDLVLAFLAENDAAFTREEVVRGVDFGDSPDEADGLVDTLVNLRSEAFDALGDLTASTLVAGDVDAALDELVAEGVVVEKTVRTNEGERTYYRVPNA